MVLNTTVHFTVLMWVLLQPTFPYLHFILKNRVSESWGHVVWYPRKQYLHNHNHAILKSSVTSLYPKMSYFYCWLQSSCHALFLCKRNRLSAQRSILFHMSWNSLCTSSLSFSSFWYITVITDTLFYFFYMCRTIVRLFSELVYFLPSNFY
jgi:hypothetical protein